LIIGKWYELQTLKDHFKVGTKETMTKMKVSMVFSPRPPGFSTPYKTL
jgi:hypothetical protein